MEKIDVIIVDDEEYILKSLRRIFREESFNVFFTTRCEEALDLLDREEIKAVVSDQKMPSMSGVDFLEKVKDKKPRVVRILFTGFADIKVAEDAINKGGVYRFINKPWNDEDLKSTVRHAVNKFDLEEKNLSLAAELKKQNEKLVSLNRRLKNMYEAQKFFSSTVSHELRTPLSSIKMAIDIITSGTAGDLTERQRDFLERAKNNVDRLNRLINDILDLSKIESGKYKLKREKGNINSLIEETVEIYRPTAERKGLYLKAGLDKNLPSVMFDSDKMNQVLSNLVSNAVKFTDSGGIEISSKNNGDGNYIEACVKDTGCGIKEEDLPKLFRKFQQLGSPAERKTGGTGLGLAICKEIISRHGGKIHVESVYGEGSRFCFILPVIERRRE